MQSSQISVTTTLHSLQQTATDANNSNKTIISCPKAWIFKHDNLLLFSYDRTVSGLVKEHFKESFDGVFEHLANAGQGGKVGILFLFLNS